MSLPSYTIANGTINGFLDNQVVQADTGTNAMNPRMNVISTAINDHAATLDVLQGQISSIGSSSVQFNVKSSTYGAKGDGTTDDTLAIQAAINDAVAYQGIVVFPTGVYKITNKLTIAGNCSLISDGASSGSYISQYTAATETFYLAGNNISISNLIFKTHTNTGLTAVIANPIATAVNSYTNITITGCQFYDYSTNVISAITLYHTSNIRIENCSFTTGVANGIALYSCSKAFIYRNDFQTTQFSVWLTRKSGTLTSYPQTNSVFVSQNNITPVSVINSIIRIDGALNIYVDRNNITLSSAITTTNTSGILCAISDTFNPAYIQITDNYIDNSAVTGQTNYFVAINVAGIDVIISRNIIIESCNAITYSGSCDALICNNTIISPYACGIYVAVLDTALYEGNIMVSGNLIIDAYNQNPFAYAINCSLAVSPGNMSIIGNSVRRGSKSSSYINTYGLYLSADVSSPLVTNGAYVNYSSNAFSSCGTPVYQTTSLFWVYYESPTGDRIFRSPTDIAPTTGTWRIGDQAIPSSPTAGGYIGYVCTTAGTPGTWKGFGAIQA